MPDPDILGKDGYETVRLSLRVVPAASGTHCNMTYYECYG